MAAAAREMTLCSSGPADDALRSGLKQAGTPRVHLLIIDDDIGPGAALVELLLLEGIRSTCAQTGESGLELAAGVSFDAILLDLKLPDILGMTVLSKLRQAGNPVPVLVTTGYYLDTDHEALAPKLGAVAYLRKPLAADELARYVFSVLNRPPEPRLPHEKSPTQEVRRRESPRRRGRRTLRFLELTALHARAVEGDPNAIDRSCYSCGLKSRDGLALCISARRTTG